MAIEAEAVVVELQAKVDGYNAAMAKAAGATEGLERNVKAVAAAEAQAATAQQSFTVAQNQATIASNNLSAAQARLSNTAGLNAQQIAKLETALLRAQNASIKATQGLADAQGRLADAQKRVASAANGVVVPTAQAANATRNLGRQIGDIGTGLATGQNPFFIIAQQSAQVADALADTGGRAAKVAAFFAGPWGAALLAAGSFLGILAGEALKSGDSIESLTKKLEDDAAKSRMAAEAQKIFERSLYGAADASAEMNKRLQDQNKSQLEVAQSALAAAIAVRQLTIQNLRGETSRRALAVADQTRTRDALQNSGGLTAAGFASAYGRANDRVTESNKALAVANKALADSESAVVEARIPLLNLRAAEDADRSAAAVGRHEDAVNQLENSYRSASAAASRLNGQAQINAQRIADANYQRGRANLDRSLAADQEAISASNRTNRASGPSAETLARRSEAERRRENREADRYADEIASLDQQIARGKAGQLVNVEQQLAAQRIQIEAERQQREAVFARRVRDNEITQVQAEELAVRSNLVAGLQNLNATLDARDAIQREEQALAGAALDLRGAELRSERQRSNSRARQLEIDLQLIDLKYDELIGAQSLIANNKRLSDAVRQQADLAITQLGIEKRTETRQTRDDAKGSYQRYRENLDSTDALADSIDGIKIDTLERVSDSLADATAKALGLSGALGDVAASIIKIGIQRKLIGPIADALFGAADGASGGGALGGLLSGLFGGGRASGGNVQAGKLYKINESGPELFQPSQSGKIYPTGAINRVTSGGGGTTINQTIRVDSRNSVTPEGFARQILGQANQFAARAADTAYKSSPKRVARVQSLGT